MFRLGGRANLEAIGEVFNLFNALNPSGFRARVIVPASGAADPNLLQPATYSGDFRRPEQRIGQLGLRFSFYVRPARVKLASGAGRETFPPLFLSCLLFARSVFDSAPGDVS